MVMPLLPAHISLHSQRELALILGNCDNKRQCSWYCDGYAASLATTRMMFHNKSRKVRPTCRFCIMQAHIIPQKITSSFSNPTVPNLSGHCSPD